MVIMFKLSDAAFLRPLERLVRRGSYGLYRKTSAYSREHDSGYRFDKDLLMALPGIRPHATSASCDWSDGLFRRRSIMAIMMMPKTNPTPAPMLPPMREYFTRSAASLILRAFDRWNAPGRDSWIDVQTVAEPLKPAIPRITVRLTTRRVPFITFPFSYSPLKNRGHHTPSHNTSSLYA